MEHSPLIGQRRIPIKNGDKVRRKYFRKDQVKIVEMISVTIQNFKNKKRTLEFLPKNV